MPSPLFIVDAFTSHPFAGNPAAVCLLSAPADGGWMQRVAAEMNLSETAFVSPQLDGFELRWFSPTVEIDLCGHATLASAHTLWVSDRLSPAEVARFQTRSGLLTATRRDDWIELDFPATPCQPAEPRADLIEALGVTPLFVGRSRFDYLVQVATEDEVQTLAPDMAALRRVGGRGIMVTAASSRAGVDFVSRFFGPAAGIDEDPVTGSAHCCLTPFWAERLGRTRLVAHQLSRRGGVLRVELVGDRVLLQGQAVMVSRGEILV